jgi:amino acid permease
MLELGRQKNGGQYGSIPSDDISATIKFSYFTSTSWSLSTISNTCNALLGVSIFTMPWGFSQAGFIGGILILIVVGCVSYETARIMLLSQRELYKKSGAIKSYPEIAAEILGEKWSIIVKFATIISCIGGNVGYIIFLGQITAQVFSCTFNTAVIGLSMPLILLSWIRSFKEMTLFTLLGVIAIGVSIFAIIYDSIMKTTHESSIQAFSIPLFLPGTIFNMLGPATFLFTIHYCILAMGEEVLRDEAHSSTTINNQNYSIFSRSLALSYFISTLCIGLLGILAFYFFRSSTYVLTITGSIESGCEDRVCQNVILNLSDGPIKYVVEISLIISIIFSYIIILAPAREHVENSVLRFLNPPANSWYIICSKNAIRTLLVVMTSVIGIAAPYFGSVLGTIGGLTDSLQSFVLPCLIYISMKQAHLSSSSLLLYRFILTWGMCNIVITAGKLLILIGKKFLVHNI